MPARRRTWQQARTLAQAGWDVRALCPRRPAEARVEVVDGIRIRRVSQPFEGRGRAGIIIEYVIAACTFGGVLARELARRRVDVIQVVNPPDWLAAPLLVLKWFGVRLAFDMADLTPALYQAKFGRRGWLYHLQAGLLRLVLRNADLVVTANETYRRTAVALGPRRASATLAVHSYPERMRPRPERRSPGPFRVGFLGVVGGQDGVGMLLHAFALLRARPDVRPVELVVVGDGPELPTLRRLATHLGLEADVRFLGFLAGAERDAAVASFDAGVAADPVNRYTRSISLNKVFAYAAVGLAIVATPLRGTRRLLGDAALYAADDSAEAMADALAAVASDDALRRTLSSKALARAQTAFDWNRDASAYAAAMAELGRRGSSSRSTPGVRDASCRLGPL